MYRLELRRDRSVPGLCSSLEMAWLSDAMETREVRWDPVDPGSTQSSVDTRCKHRLTAVNCLDRETLLFRSFFSIMPMESMKCHLNPMWSCITMARWIGSRRRSINQVATSMWNSFPSVNNSHQDGFPRRVSILDQQTCELRFGSWTYDQRQMNFSYYDETERRVTIKDYVVSGSWDLMDGPMSIQQSSLTPSVNTDNETSNSIASITSARIEKADGRDRVEFVCTLFIRRKTLFYTVNLIIPTVGNERNLFEANWLLSLVLSLGADLVFIHLRLLSADGCRWKDDLVYFDLARSRCVSLTDIENSPTDIDCYPTDCQISPIYIYYEYYYHILYGGDY